MDFGLIGKEGAYGPQNDSKMGEHGPLDSYCVAIFTLFAKAKSLVRSFFCGPESIVS